MVLSRDAASYSERSRGGDVPERGGAVTERGGRSGDAASGIIFFDRGKVFRGRQLVALGTPDVQGVQGTTSSEKQYPMIMLISL